MIPLPSVKRIFLYREAVDMRKSFDGLSSVASQKLRENPLSGSLFVFFNKRCSMVKLLFWDRGGLTIIAKRLEKGTFQIPVSQKNKVTITPTDLQLILEGINLNSIRYRKRYNLLE